MSRNNDSGCGSIIVCIIGILVVLYVIGGFFGNLYHYNETGDKTPAVIASTASPYKFSRSVLQAVAPETELPNTEFDTVDKLNEITKMPVPAPLAGLKDKKVRFTDVTEVDKMQNYVLSALGIE